MTVTHAGRPELIAELGAPPSATSSCAKCPSAMTADEVLAATGKSIGGPACAIKMLPLIQPKQTMRVRARTASHIASGCSSFGKPRPENDPNAVRAPITFGPVGIGRPLAGAIPTTLTNCVGCANFIPSADVASKTGWNAAICAAKGTLLMNDRLRTYAQNCKDSTVAPPGETQRRVLIEKFNFFPEYNQNFGEVDREQLAKKSRSMDPLDWSTDKAVSGDDFARGIKAWRRIDDPDGDGASTYLPIYHPETFPPEERRLIPLSGDREHPELYHDYSGSVYQLAVMLMELDITPAVWGPPGVGKTELGRHLAWLMQLPFARLTVTESTEVDDLFGKMMYDPSRGTYFQYGRLPERWSRPGVICLDEPNTGQNALWQRIRPLTDNSRQMVLDEGDKKIISRHRDCSFYMAMNPAWSPLNIGTNTIGDADARRMLHLYLDLPPENIEKQIIIERCIALNGYDPSPHLTNIMKIAADIRRMAADGEIPITWGTANQIKVARLMQWFGPMKAYRAAVLDYLDPAVATQIANAINSVYPV